ncbi:hypothetical protein ACFY3N_25100 [Streptomyces sp. NPDC000348]|uniref:hypothetical protein n=1 Tax=Streptomyces sp. NPDC000348 TaxID=3364538 RepID=UPI003692B396
MTGRNGRTVRDLRRADRTAVPQRLYFDGPLSRFEPGPATGLGSGSVSNVVADPVADGLVDTRPTTAIPTPSRSSCWRRPRGTWARACPT